MNFNFYWMSLENYFNSISIFFMKYLYDEFCSNTLEETLSVSAAETNNGGKVEIGKYKYIDGKIYLNNQTDDGYLVANMEYRLIGAQG